MGCASAVASRDRARYPSRQPGEPVAQPTRAEFREEVLAALHAAGLEGPFESRDDRLIHTSTGSFDLAEAYDNLGGLDAPERADLLARAIQSFVTPPEMPKTWDEARGLVLPSLKPRISLAAEEVRRARGAVVAPTPRLEITPHLVMELALRRSATQLVLISGDVLGMWAVSPDDAYRAAFENLRRLPDVGWGLIDGAPRAFFSQWKDGFDASRIGTPAVFGRVRAKGRPVVLAPSPSAIAFAGSDDSEGLFHLARMTRQLFEKSRRYLFLRAIRLGEDGESWEDWMPPRSHPAFPNLRLLRAVNESGDYDEQAKIMRRAAEGQGATVAMPRLEVHQSGIGADVLTTTRWKSGPSCALPIADAVVLEREGEVLGVAPWQRVVEALNLKAVPGYPTRYLAPDFPEEWQMGQFGLKPWRVG